jgi:hypothetical protein
VETEVLIEHCDALRTNSDKNFVTPSDLELSRSTMDLTGLEMETFQFLVDVTLGRQTHKGCNKIEL